MPKKEGLPLDAVGAVFAIAAPAFAGMGSVGLVGVIGGTINSYGGPMPSPEVFKWCALAGSALGAGAHAYFNLKSQDTDFAKSVKSVLTAGGLIGAMYFASTSDMFKDNATDIAFTSHQAPTVTEFVEYYGPQFTSAMKTLANTLDAK